MRIYLAIIFLQLFLPKAWSQKAHPKFMANLPTNLYECSGITINQDGTFWAHNDSGDKPVIYKVDTLGNLLKALYLKGAKAIDYEDITQDEHGNIYVCDCGNNQNKRSDLCIYKITKTAIDSENDTVTPQVIHFNYVDQKLFPPTKSKRNFDCEALVAYKDSIFLFTKNRGESNYCKRYVIPTLPGNYSAMLLDSIQTKRWVTSAALSSDNKTLVLLSENHLTIFNHFSSSNFFEGNKISVHIPTTQKEALAFKDNGLLYITDERFKSFGGKLYKLNIMKFIEK